MDAQSAFAEILENLPRQHLRTYVRGRFGTERSDFGEKTFARGTVRVEADRRLGHLMQEEPEELVAYLIAGPTDTLRASHVEAAPGDTLGAIAEGHEGERFLLVHGASARLYVYYPSDRSEVWVRRVAVAKPDRPNAKPPAPVLSRRQRAAQAGKKKPLRKPQRRR